MPYVYIGKTLSFKGKTLWEILGNLKNFGVGRIVVRSMFERYPEPSYLKILEVEALANPINPNPDNLRKVRIVAEKTFRGITYSKPVVLQAATYKADYKLIPKDEEAQYCKLEGKMRETKIVPKTMPFPPLLHELIIRDCKAKGEPISNDPQMEIVYSNSKYSNYRIAEDGEKPDIEIPIDLGTPASPSLYQGI